MYCAFPFKLVLVTSLLLTPFAFSQMQMQETLKGKSPAQVNQFIEKISQKNTEPDYSWPGFDLKNCLQKAAALENKIELFRKSKQVKTQPLVTDDVFVRRAYLDLAGRIPTIDESRSFIAASSPSKRTDLIFQILGSEDYVRQFYNYWGSLLRVQSYMQGMPPKAYETWVKNALRKNLPYDVWVRQMITAKGAADSENGAAGFVIRDRETGILDAMSETSQLFLGSQIGCAMCHNAKFEKWKQKEFYALSAYYSEVQMIKDPMKSRELYTSMKGKSAEEARKTQRALRELPFIVYDKPDKELNLPDKFVYEPELSGKPIEPAVLYGTTPTIGSHETRREAFARWLTAPENPNFTMSIANRLWAKVLGLGLIEPVNDLSENSTSRSPDILNAATQLMKDLHYDLRSYIAVLALTKTYQLQTADGVFDTEKYAFDSHPLRRMKAEELKDSLVVAQSGHQFTNLVAMSEKMATISSEEMQKRIELNAYGKPEDMAAARKNVAEEMNATMTSGSSMNGAAGGQMNAMRGGFGVGIFSYDQFQPPRAGTFLDQFGASKRDVVGEGSIEANIAQALTLMNGEEVSRLSSLGGKNGLLALLGEAKSDPPKAIDTLCYALYSRAATSDEQTIIGEHLKKNGLKGITDIIWAMINNREFIFVQ